jgi:hypothetical protein
MPDDTGKISDGYHTFDELYAHRFALWKALCRKMAEFHHRCDDVAWKSKVHSDGTNYPGWFLLGMFYEDGQQITYHLPLSEWNSCGFAKTLEIAPAFDGHTPNDVIARIERL